MNYTIIGFSQSTLWVDRHENERGHKAMHLVERFREQDRDTFVKVWARLTERSTYDELTILLNGLAEEDWLPGSEEDVAWDAVCTLYDKERIHAREVFKAEKAAAREAAAQEAVDKARRIAKAQRERDEAELLRLKAKLGAS